jgi:hypothetical protein
MIGGISTAGCDDRRLDLIVHPDADSPTATAQRRPSGIKLLVKRAFDRRTADLVLGRQKSRGRPRNSQKPLMGLQQRLVEAFCCPTPLPVSTFAPGQFEVYD